MCCGCWSGCGQCAGNMVYIMEKLASFAALTAVVLCIMVTVAITLGLGIGLGYNYCFVDLKVVQEEKHTTPEGVLHPSPDDATPLYRRHMVTTVLPQRTITVPAIKHTMAIPLNGEFDFPALLSKLRSRNRNVTLELITITLCLTCVGLVSCFVITFVLTLGMGIGLGYNYCFVDMKTKYKYVPGHYVYPGSPRRLYNRQGYVVQESEFKEAKEIDALRMLPSLPENIVPTIHSSPKIRQDGNETDPKINNTPTTPNDVLLSLPVNATELPIETSSVTSNKNTEIVEGSSETTVPSTINSTTEGKPGISNETTPEPTSVPTPEPSNIDDTSSRKVKQLVIPISGLDLISLLSKLKAENKNYSLHIVTT